ncbi:hypothetical protein ACFSUS_05930 [Spirosoma soli]|uniref:Uncharacterized protein n=1 Tax=Spirosoma soli TaxID=1770529 RepID=A0ABW5M1K8_9BACT
MKTTVIAICCALFMAAQPSMGQAVQEKKAIKKETKAEKKIAKAETKVMNAQEHKGVEIPHVSDPKTRTAKAEKKVEKAVKKELKSDSKELKAVAKVKKKQGEKAVD